MSPDDILDIWAAMSAGFIGPHAEYLRAINIVASIDVMSANNIGVTSGKRAKDPRKPREVFPGIMDFFELQDGADEETKMNRMMGKLNG